MRSPDELDTLVIQTVIRLTKDLEAMTAKTDELAAAVADIQSNVVAPVAAKIDELVTALHAAKANASAAPSGTIEDSAAIDAVIAQLAVIKTDLLGKVNGAVVA